MRQRFQKINWETASLLFLPWAVSSIPGLSPQVVWWLAWSGSLWIFALVWSGTAGGIDGAVPWKLRILHPVFLMQGIFAGYGFVTSIFYWLDINGIAPPGVGAVATPGLYSLAAEVQRYYVLAHAALAFGLIFGSRISTRRPYRPVWKGSLASLLLCISAGASLVGLLFNFVPGLGQLAIVFSRLGLVAGATSLGPSLAPRGRQWLGVSLVINLLLLALACVSGWKEEVLVLIILTGLATFPFYPRSTVIVGSIAFAASMVVLPVLSSVIRSEAWMEKTSKWVAFDMGIEKLFASNSEELTESSWAFFTERLSECGMFMTYIASVDRGTPREGVEILRQTLLAPIPRVVWQDKPDLEKQVMQRVYAHGVASELSSISAKPHPVVDAYLVGGGVGVCLIFIFIGWVGSLAYSFCQSNFGGIFLGGVFFNGLFSILWRGNAFEFMFSTLLWASVIALALAWWCRTLGWTRQLKSHSGRGPRVKAGRLVSRD